MKTNFVKAFNDAMLSSTKNIDCKEIGKKLASSFSGIEEKIGKNGSKKILDTLEGLAAQGKSVVTSVPTPDFAGIVQKILK